MMILFIKLNQKDLIIKDLKDKVSTLNTNYEKYMKTFSRPENMTWQVIAIIITVRGRINTEYDRLP